MVMESGDIWKAANDAKNVFLQSAPSGNFELTTRVEVKPYPSNDHASLLLWHDMDNFVEVTRQFAIGYGGPIVVLASEKNGQAQNQIVQPIQDVPVTDLRLRVVNGEATASYSLDGATWTTLGVTPVPQQMGSIGLFCHGSGEVAVFDWFHIALICD